MNRLVAILVIFCSLQPLFAQRASTSSEARNLLAGKPVLFLENKGQFKDVTGQAISSVLFRAASKTASAYITEKGLTYVFSRLKETTENRFKGMAPDPGEGLEVEMEWINIHLEGADIRSENVIKEQIGKTEYRFFSEKQPNGIAATEYERITIKDVYPGIDWVLYGNSESGMKYDFIVHPGANPASIRLLYEGDQPFSLDRKGNIQIDLRLGSLTESAPVSFTQEGQKISSAFEQERIDQYKVRITYKIGSYPKNQNLIIDPELTWGTRYGGHNNYDYPVTIANDASGNIFLSGSTYSVDFPVLNSGTYFQGSLTAGGDAFILKFSGNGVLDWATYYGGSAEDVVSSMERDSNGNIFLVGRTGSANFPVQNSGTYFQAPSAGIADYTFDAFILKFDNSGNRLWATCYGGSGSDIGRSVTVDQNNNVFVSGYTFSLDFPVQNSGTYFQGSTNSADSSDAFILKFDNNGNRLWATYYGGSLMEEAHSIHCDGNGNILIGGHTFSTDFPVLDAGTYFQGAHSGGIIDAFILKFDNAGNRLWATYYGGNGEELAQNVVADSDGNIFVMGSTHSTDFPLLDAGTFFDNTLGGPTDQYILKFDNAGNRLWATLFGGDSYENDFMTSSFTSDNISFDDCNNVYFAFMTVSGDVPTMDDGVSYFDGTYAGGTNGFSDVFITRFTNTGMLMWASYLGGDEFTYTDATVIDDNNNLFMTGTWGQYGPIGDLLVDPGSGAYYDPTGISGDTDGYIFKFASQATNTGLYTTSQTSPNCNCSGSATVELNGIVTPPISYTWSNGSQTVNATSLTNTITGLCPGNYWVEIIYCNYTDTAFFTLNPVTPPVVSFAAEDTAVCLGSCTDFTSNTVAGATYSWNFGDGNSSTDTDPTHCYSIPGNFPVSLTVTDGVGCTTTETKVSYIDIHPVPVAAFTATPVITGIFEPEVSFTEQASGENSWHWDFADAAGESDEQNPVYKYNSVGDYNVSLIVSNTFGCTDTAFLTIRIYDDFAFYAPNAFSPNGDGVNDTWFPVGSGIDASGFKVSVFDRWGELIWTTTIPGEGWDGKYKGEIVQHGVYTWTAVVSTGQIPAEYNGSVTVVR